MLKSLYVRPLLIQQLLLCVSNSKLMMMYYILEGMAAADYNLACVLNKNKSCFHCYVMQIFGSWKLKNKNSVNMHLAGPFLT